MKNRIKPLKILIVVITILLMRGITMANNEVKKEVLDNGVTVLIKENHTASVAAVNFWVKVGSAFENSNEKGMTHFIEHLLFKGTEKRGLGDIDKEIKELGGYNNAFTSYDATNYVIVLPSEHINKAIEIEYDAITGSVFDPAEVDKERDVVLAELHRGQDNPHNYLWQKLMKLSFKEYYKDPIIGYEEILKNSNRNRIVNFYKRYYLPENLVVVVAGDVDSKKVMDYIKSTFGKMKKKNSSTKEQEVTLKKGLKMKYKAMSGNIESRYFAIGFKIPDVLSSDIPKLEILARILGGSESSPMYRIIKEEKQLVDDIDVDIFAGKFGGLFVVSGTARKGKYAEVLKEIFLHLKKVKRFGVEPEEIGRVKSDIFREEAKENMKVENIAMNLGYYEVLDKYEMYDTYYSQLKRVIDSDLKDVALEYLNHENSTLVLYYPKASEKEFKKYKTVKSVENLVVIPNIKTTDSPEGVTKTTLNNGMQLIYKKLSNTDIVAAKFMFKGGIVYEGAQDGYYRGITNLMMETMLKGTKTMNAAEIAEEIDNLGAILGKDMKKDSFGWGMEVLNNNFDPLIELFSDIIRNPAFTLGEIKKEKTDIINMIKRRKDSPSAYAVKLFNELLFEWHPYGYPLSGEIDSIKRTSSTRIKKWHSDYVRPNNLIVSVVGNVEFEQVKDILNKYFKNWKAGKQLNPNLPVKITNVKKSKRETIKKNQTHIVMGFLGLKASSKDYYAFRVLDAILSGGMNSRLFTEVRDKKNLCYTIYSTFDRNIERGAFKIYTATAPENEKAAIDEILKVLKDVYDNGVTKYEVETAQSYINGMYKIGFQDYSAQGDAYNSYEMLGLGYKNVDVFIDNIFKVTKKDVDAIVKKYFKLDKYTIVVLGPDEKKTDKK